MAAEITTPASDALMDDPAELRRLDQRALAARQIELAYQNLLQSLGAGMVVMAMVLGAILYAGAVAPVVWWWAGILFSWKLFGIATWFAFRRAKPQPQQMQFWAWLSTGGSAIAGALWGAAAFMLMDESIWPFQTLITGAICVCLAAGIAGNAVHLPTMFGFGGAATLTAAAAMALSRGDMQHYTIAAVIIAIGVAMLQYGRNFNRVLVREITLELNNSHLVEQLTRKQQALEAANATKTRFLAAASHDLRQPMHALGLFAAALGEWVGDAQGKHVHQRLTDSIDSMQALIDELLSISTLDAGAVVARQSPIALQSVFDTLAGPFGELARNKRLRLDVVPTSVVVMSDAKLLHRVLANLLSNAIRYTERGGVVIGCRRRGDQVRVDVVDSGVGIPAEALDHVFEEFVQLGNPERDRSKGIGLGLAIVRRLAALLGAHVSVQSRLGHGSRFSVLLPRVLHHAQAPSAAPAPHSSAANLQGLLVVLIDDEIDIRAGTQALLRRWGVFVIAAASAQEAMSQLAVEARIADLILCDLRLRDGANGVSAVQTIRTHLQEQVPALLISGDKSALVEREAAAAGLPIAYKPLNAPQLREAINAALQQQTAAA